MVVSEALGAGLAVVATPSVGANVLLEDSGEDVIATRSWSNALADAPRTLFDDPAAIAAATERARSFGRPARPSKSPEEIAELLSGLSDNIGDVWQLKCASWNCTCRSTGPMPSRACKRNFPMSVPCRRPARTGMVATLQTPRELK